MLHQLGDYPLARTGRKRKEQAALPPGTGLDTVDNPYDVGPAKIVALRSYRDDPLALMLARRQIDQYHFAAGRAWQGLQRAAEVTPLQAMDPTKEPVDGGGNKMEYLSDQKLAAVKRLNDLRATTITPMEENLLYGVLIDGMSLREYTHAHDWPTAHAVKTMGRRFRQALEKLARKFGYA